MTGVEVLGQIGPDGPSLFVLYTGGPFGMGPGADGSLVPLDLHEIGVHVPFHPSASARAHRGDVPRPDRLVRHGHKIVGLHVGGG